MLFVLISQFLLLITYINAKPYALDGNVVRFVQIPDEFEGQESHPYQVVVNPSASETVVEAVEALEVQPSASAPMEVSDDDSYDSTAPVGVVAVPAQRPSVYADISDSDGDLSGAATDLHAAASGHGGGDASGWLDMGAYSSGHGAFGWYADYPVGGGHGYGR